MEAQHRSVPLQKTPLTKELTTQYFLNDFF